MQYFWMIMIDHSLIDLTLISYRNVTCFICLFIHIYHEDMHIGMHQISYWVWCNWVRNIYTHRNENFRRILWFQIFFFKMYYSYSCLVLVFSAVSEFLCSKTWTDKAWSRYKPVFILQIIWKSCHSTQNLINRPCNMRMPLALTYHSWCFCCILSWLCIVRYDCDSEHLLVSNESTNTDW